MSSYWRQKTCLVTGASAGLGRAIAAELASHGAKVVVNARRAEPLERAAAELQREFGDRGAQVSALAGDVTRQEDVDRIAAAVQGQFGGLDMLCNCAGRSTRAGVLDATPDDIQELLDANFLSAVRMTRAAAPMLIARRGSLVNIGSLASKIAPRYMGGYPASKHALAAYTQQLRLELGPEGLHVLLVCPGPIRRDGVDDRYAADVKGIPAGAQAPGGGAPVKAIDPRWLAVRILAAAERGQPELVVPGKARLLFALAQLWPGLGDWYLNRKMP